MAVSRHNPDHVKRDIAQSVDLFNKLVLEF